MMDGRILEIRLAIILLNILKIEDPREMGRQFLTEVGFDFLGIITILAVLKLSGNELVPERTSLKALTNRFIYKS